MVSSVRGCGVCVKDGTNQNDQTGQTRRDGHATVVSHVTCDVQLMAPFLSGSLSSSSPICVRCRHSTELIYASHLSHEYRLQKMRRIHHPSSDRRLNIESRVSRTEDGELSDARRETKLRKRVLVAG